MHSVDSQRQAIRDVMATRNLRIAPWARRAGIRESTLRNFLDGRSQSLTSRTLVLLASAIDTSVSDLLGERLAGGHTEQCHVLGAVQAGYWREALEWPEDEWFPIIFPADRRYRDVRRFGLMVRGPSMNLVYPEGATLVCVRFEDLGRGPRHGERVICQRRNREGFVEATVKEFVLQGGEAWLWPRSDHPEYQVPYRLSPPGSGDGEETARAAHYVEEIEPFALIVGSFRPE